MKKEQLFEAIGEIDDKILERYRRMDQRLARKHAQKKRTLHVLAVAACLCLLLGACLPIGMMIAQLAGEPNHDSELPGTSAEQGTADVGEESEHGNTEQATEEEDSTPETNDQTIGETQQETVDDSISYPPSPSISLRSMEALALMREMIMCEDEEAVQEYLRGIEGGGADDKQDLVDFVALVDGTPYAWLVQGEVTWLHYQNAVSVDTNEPYEIFYVSVEAENGDWMRVEYLLNVEDPLMDFLLEVEQAVGDRNVLPTAAQSADGRMKMYFETREPHPSGTGETVTWWGLMDDKSVRITYYLQDGAQFVTWEKIGTVRVTSLIDPDADTSANAQPMPNIMMSDHPFAWCDTKFGAYLEQPEMHIYAITGGGAPTLAGLQVDLDLECAPYIDDSAPPTVRAEFDGTEYVLSYFDSYPHSIHRQAVHCYSGSSEIGSYTAMIDQQTGACVAFRMEYAKIDVYQSMTDSKVRTYITNYAKQHLGGDTDPSEYVYGGGVVDGKYTIYEVSRVVPRGNHMLTGEMIYVTMHTESKQIVGFERVFIGSMNCLEPVPQQMYDAIYDTLESVAPAYFAQFAGYKPNFPIVITEDGRLAMDCTLPVEYFDEELQQTVTDSISMLFYLTEPLP